MTTPTTSASGTENVNGRIEDVENFLKAIKTEFNDKDGLVASNENADNNVVNINSSGDEDGMKSMILSFPEK